jgi:hypothetical protein
MDYLDAMSGDDAVDEDRAELALALLEHFAALEGHLVLSFPPGTDDEDARQEHAIASNEEIRWGQMPGHGNAYQVLCSCPPLAKSKGVVRTFDRRDQALGYWRHLRHLRTRRGDLIEEASAALVDDDTPAAKPNGKGSKGKAGGPRSDSGSKGLRSSRK